MFLLKTRDFINKKSIYKNTNKNFLILKKKKKRKRKQLNIKKFFYLFLLIGGVIKWEK